MLSITEENKKGRELYDEILEELKSETISGKTMNDWRTYFTVKIPPDLNPKITIEYLTKVSELYQEACFFKARADRIFQVIKRSSESEFRDAVNATALSYDQQNKKRPAKDILLMEAENKVKDIRVACSTAEIELSFWKEILNNLSTVRKVLEQCTMNLGIERKMLSVPSYYESDNGK